MVTDKAEQISALMDGELDGPDIRRALDELTQDDGLKTCWGRYHLISDVLRNHAPYHLKHSLGQDVMHMLRNEPPLQHTSGWRSRRAFKPLAGFALAASVAALAIFSVQTFVFTSPSIDNSLMASASPTPVAVLSGSNNSSRSRWGLAQPASEARLNRYLTNHNEYSTSAGIQGVLPYARIVAYDADK